MNQNLRLKKARLQDLKNDLTILEISHSSVDEMLEKASALKCAYSKGRRSNKCNQKPHNIKKKLGVAKTLQKQNKYSIGNDCFFD
jgi:hypothetical protein